MSLLKWGVANETMILRSDQASAFGRLHRALGRIGEVYEVRSGSLLRGRTRVGLQRVSLNVSVTSEDGDAQTVLIEAFADDIWGGGARLGIRKFKRAVDQC